MRAEQRFRQASRFEQSEAQQHRIAHAGPDGGGHIPTNADILHQHGIDAHAHHDKECHCEEGKARRGNPHPLSRSDGEASSIENGLPHQSADWFAMTCFLS